MTNTSDQRRFVLLDRDGTIIVQYEYLNDPDRVELLPGALDGLRRMRDLGLGLIVVTNQSGVARGRISSEELAAIHVRMVELLAAEGIELQQIYVCPHAPDEGCACRKPRSGMVDQAASDWGFDPRQAFVVGDKACDVDLGRAVGATTFLVRTGYGHDHERRQTCQPDYVVDDLAQVAELVARLIVSGG